MVKCPIFHKEITKKTLNLNVVSPGKVVKQPRVRELAGKQPSWVPM